RGVLRPTAQRVLATKADRTWIRRQDAAEAVVEYAVHLGSLVDPGVLRGRVVDQAAEAVEGRGRAAALPEQATRVHLRADVGGVDFFSQPNHRGRVVDQVVRVHLDGDLHVGVGGAGLDVLPVRDRHLVPLVVTGVEVDADPRQDRPGGRRTA